MNERNEKIKTALCFMIAAVDFLTFIYDIFIYDIPSGDFTTGAFALTSVISTVLAYLPTFFIIVYALQREPHRFIVPLYIRGILNIISQVTAVFMVAFSAFSGYTSISISPDEGMVVNSNEVIVNVLLSSLISLYFIAFNFLCARAISKQKNGEEGFTTAFVIASSLLTALGFVTSAVTHFSIGILSETVEEVLLILVVKYVEEKRKTDTDGLMNYPTPEEMSENEQEKS